MDNLTKDSDILTPEFQETQQVVLYSYPPPMTWNPLIWLLSAFNSWLFNTILDSNMSLFNFRHPSLKMFDPALQPSETPNLCHHLPSDGSVDFIGTMPKSPWETTSQLVLPSPTREVYDCLLAIQHQIIFIALHENGDWQCGTVSEPCAPGK